MGLNDTVTKVFEAYCPGTAVFETDSVVASADDYFLFNLLAPDHQGSWPTAKWKTGGESLEMVGWHSIGDNGTRKMAVFGWYETTGRTDTIEVTCQSAQEAAGGRYVLTRDVDVDPDLQIAQIKKTPTNDFSADPPTASVNLDPFWDERNRIHAWFTTRDTTAAPTCTSPELSVMGQSGGGTTGFSTSLASDDEVAAVTWDWEWATIQRHWIGLGLEIRYVGGAMAPVASAQSALSLGPVIGNVNPGTVTQNLSTADLRVALSFVAAEDVITDFMAMLSATTGSPGTNIECAIQADSADLPSGTNIRTATLAVSAQVGLNTWTGFGSEAGDLTAGNKYWAVLRNTNADPSSNHVTVRICGSAYAYLQQTGVTAGWVRRTSSDAGANWTNVTANSQGWAIVYGSGASDGSLVDNATLTGTADGAFGTQECGDRFLTPPGPTLRVIGVSMLIGSTTGSPNGDLVFRFYPLGSTTALATSRKASPFSGNTYASAEFASVVLLAPDTEYRVMAADSSGTSTSGNRYNMRRLIGDGSALAKSLRTLSAVKTVLASGSFADTDVEHIPFALILQTDRPFERSGGALYLPGVV